MPVGKMFKSLTAGEPQPADVGRLEEELSQLWRSAAEDSDTEHPVMRACVLTLLVYVENEEAGHETLQLISNVIAQNPCRAVIMIAEPDGRPEGLSAWISAQCHLPAPGAKQVCCEQICVQARGEAVKGLGNVVIPLAVPGLPIYLWWRAARFAPPAFLDQLLRGTDRVVVDSARFLEPESDLWNLARQVQRFKGTEKVAFSDLNWARLTPCRELIAQCFDSAKASACLQDLTEVRLEWRQGKSNGNGHMVQALLLTGWLASRLGWQPASRVTANSSHSKILEFRQGSKKVRVECRGLSGGSEPSPSSSVILQTATTPPGRFSVIESKEAGCIRTRAELPGCPSFERTMRLISMDEVELLNEELKFPGGDRIYEEALGLVAGMVDL